MIAKTALDYLPGTESDGQQWIELNATKNEITIRPLHVGQEVLIVIGEELREEKIKSYLKIPEI